MSKNRQINNGVSSHLQLISIEMRKIPDQLDREFPFNLPFICKLNKLDFNVPVTLLVGENGSGKSTFLEALACGTRLPTIGSESVTQDPSLQYARNLAGYIKFVWSRNQHKGFFLRAEDFFGYAKKIKMTRIELENELKRVDIEYKDRSEFSKGYAKMPFSSELADLQNRYGDGLDNQSHGESFLKLFQNRLIPKGLYLLDEPEAPLSPLRQLSFLSILKEMVGAQSQFIIATHSPILMAFPNAEILSFDNGFIHPMKYQDLEHVNLTRSFLNNPEAYLNHL